MLEKSIEYLNYEESGKEEIVLKSIVLAGNPK